MPLPILCYHKVSDESAEGRWLNIHPETLAKHAAFFARRGFEFLRAGSLSQNSWPNRAVCLTFDDAYASALENGLEALARAGAVATFYVVSKRVGGKSEWDPGREGTLATWDQLAAASSQGHEIGNHTAEHADLAKLTLEDQIEQIRICDEALAQHGFAKTSFCFPYGGRTDVSSKALSECGHKVGLALGGKWAKPGDDRLALPRIVISYGDRIPMLLYKLYVKPRLK